MYRQPIRYDGFVKKNLEFLIYFFSMIIRNIW